MNGTHEVAISGGGIGGLSAALALARSGVSSVVFERQAQWSEVGAGVQLGPNATRHLIAWGLEKALLDCASWPERIEALNARSGGVLSTLPLGPRCHAHYGAPYATLMRADLQRLLLEGVERLGLTHLRLGERLLPETLQASESIERTPSQAALLAFGVRVEGLNLGSETQRREVAPLASGNAAQVQTHLTQALIGADGVFSQLREHLFQAPPLQYTGHLAYRALVARADLPAPLRSNAVRLFLGPKMHWVQYPVRGGEWFNVVALLEVESARAAERAQHLARQRRFLSNPWHEQATEEPLSRAEPSQDLQALQEALARSCTALRDVASLVPAWTVWPLFAAKPLLSGAGMCQGHVALLGDAAHPMLPYLAQGAGMSIEDAQALSRCWGERSLLVSERFALYAQWRWQRCAQVQRRASRNATLFHWGGPLGFMRDRVLAMFGSRLMDLPWLYSA
jgi:salicylate hydroxylase